MRRLTVLLILGGLFGVSRAARAEQDLASLFGPLLGYVYDPAWQGIRAIRGIPGAAVLDRPADLGLALRAAVIAPSHEYALVITADADRLGIVDLREQPRLTRIMEGQWSGPIRMAISPAGTAAALHSPAEAGVWIINGLPDHPWWAGRLELAREQVLGDFAISDDGTVVLAAVAPSSQGGVLVLAPQGPTRVLFPSLRASAVAFLKHSLDAVIAEGERNEVYRLRDVKGAAELMRLASVADGISGPTSLAVSGDGSLLWVGNAQTNTVATVPLEGGPVRLISCPRAASELQPLRGNAVVRVGPGTSPPLWILQTGPDESKLLFVPEIQSSADEPQNELEGGGR